jgi:hypothetical protein
MKIKDYEKLKFDDRYKQKGYSKKMYPLLNEYFSRMKYEFNLSDEEVEYKLQCLLINIDKFDYTKKIPNEFKNSIGLFDSSNKTITLNKNLLNGKSKLNFFNTFCHEVNHATDYNPYSLNDGMYKKIVDQNGNVTYDNNNTCLNEIVTEMKSTLITNNERDSEKYIKTDGYPDLIFAGSMLSATLGVSDKEFLTVAERGREYFDDYMSSKFPSRTDYESFMNGFNIASGTLHSLKYTDCRNDFTNQDLANNLFYAAENLKDNCLWAMNLRMQQDIALNNNINIEQYTTKQRFLLDKIDINYKEGLRGMNFDEDVIYNLCNKNVYDEQVQDRIMLLETLDDNKEKLSNTEYMNNIMLCGLSRNSKECLDRIQNDYGFYPNSKTKEFDRTMDLQYVQQVLNEEYGDEKWEDPQFNEVVSKNFYENNIFKKIYNKVSSIKSIFKKEDNQKLLPQTNHKQDFKDENYLFSQDLKNNYTYR